MPILRGRFLAAAQKQFEELEQQAASLEQQRADLVAQAAANTPRVDGADPALLPRLLASLRDATDHIYTKVWRRIITSLTFTTTPSDRPGRTSRVLRWRGAIKLDAGSDGTKAVHNRRHVERHHEFLAAMLDGTPFDAAGLPARHANRPRVARLLGVDDGHPLFNCDDAHIVAAATAMLRHDQVISVPAPDGDPGFLAAVRRVRVDDRTARPWRSPHGVVVTAFYELTAPTGTVKADDIVNSCSTTPGTAHTAFSTLRRPDPNWSSPRQQGYVLAPCQRCGSHDRRPSEIAEIARLLCCGCGYDEAGVHWSLAVFGRYLPESPGRKPSCRTRPAGCVMQPRRALSSLSSQPSCPGPRLMLSSGTRRRCPYRHYCLGGSGRTADDVPGAHHDQGCARSDAPA